MKRVYIFAMAFVLSSSAIASSIEKSVLDKITYQVAAKEWVSSKSALLSVDINASLGNDDVLKARDAMKDNLQKIASGDWHIVQFERTQDSSGLEKIYARAEARVEQTNLANVFQNAKSVSKPGATYAVSEIAFKPSLAELEAARSLLREKLYKQANDELAKINQIYKEQHYTLLNLVFVDGYGAPPVSVRANAMMTELIKAVPVMAISNELNMSAVVQVASNRKQGD